MLIALQCKLALPYPPPLQARQSRLVTYHIIVHCIGSYVFELRKQCGQPWRFPSATSTISQHRHITTTSREARVAEHSSGFHVSGAHASNLPCADPYPHESVQK